MNNEQLTGVGEAITDAATEIVPPTLLELTEDFFASPLGGLVRIVLLIAVTVIVSGAALRMIKRASQSAVTKMKAAGNPNATLVSFLRYVADAIVYFIAFSIVVSNIPVLNAAMNKLLAAGGVLAVVLGVAGQEALGAIASGVMILFFKPFMIGDVVNVVSVGVSGTVEDISLRHTVLKTPENKRVIIPNSTMNTAVVENFDYGERRVCLPMEVGVTYECDLERAIEVLADEIAKHPHFLDVRSEAEKKAGVPLVTVRVTELADSAVVLRALLWGADNGTAIVMKSDLLRRVKARFDREGIPFAYPHLQIVQDA